MDPIAVIGLFASGIGGLWYALNRAYTARLADKDKQITELRRERNEARNEVKALNAVLETNTATLTRVANTLELQERLQRRALSTVTVQPESPTLPDGAAT